MSNIPPSKPAANRPTLPEKRDIEMLLLSCVLQSHNTLRTIIGLGCTVHHFTFQPYRIIWQSVLQMHEDDIPPGLIEATNWMRDAHGQTFEQMQLAGHVTDCFAAILAPSEETAKYYFETIDEVKRRRDAIAAAEKVKTAAQDPMGDWKAEAERLRGEFSPGSWPKLVDARDLLGPKRPKRPPVLINHLLHKGSKLIIGGTSKGRKTWTLVDLAVSVAAGASWWGYNCTAGKVCYINFEIQDGFFADRLEIIERAKQTQCPPGSLHVWNLRGFTEGIEHMSAVIIRQLEKADYSLVIVDPIYKALGDRDENKAGDVASMLNEFERIAVRTGAAIAFGSHFSKGNQAAKDAMDRIGGSGVFARDPDAILTMTAHEEEDAYTVETSLRNFPPQPSFVARWEFPLFKRDDNADPSLLKAPKRRNDPYNSGRFSQKFSIDDVLTQMGITQGWRPGTLQKQCKEECGMAPSTFWRLWNAAKTDGKVIAQDGLWRRAL
ncbi:MAG: AAA family ATPase [Chthoniobacterales bacterium]|nr:AAA family ATPase [Chthoniobacterales bacterium]